MASDSLAQIYVAALAHFGITGIINNAENLTKYFVELANGVGKNI